MWRDLAPESEPGTGADRLAALLEQVKSEHRRLVEEHTEEIRGLQEELDLHRRLLSSPSNALKKRNKIRTDPATPTSTMSLRGDIASIASLEVSNPPASPRVPAQDAAPCAQGAAAAETCEEERKDAVADTPQEGMGAASAGLSRSPAQLSRATTSMWAAQQKHNKVHIRDKQHEPPEFVPSDNRILRFIENLVRHSCFDLVFSALIGVNAVLMACELEFTSTVLAGELGYEAERYSQSQVVSAKRFWAFIGFFFGGLFTVEIILRMVAQRRKFPRDVWNWIDLVLVLLWLFGHVGPSLPVNTMVLRLLRLAKLTRLLRLVRRFEGFDALFLMTTAMRSSLSILLWTTCLLCSLMLLLAFIVHELLMDFYLTKTSNPFEERLQIHEYFGSFTKSLFSMFELTLANWPTISRVLVNDVSGWFIMYAILHKVVVGFALLGIINGVFIQETFKMAQSDDEVMMRKARLASRMHAQKMEALVATVDVTGKCLLDIHMFRQIFNDPSLKSWLSSMELSPSDADTLFEMMDSDESGQLTLDEVITGVAKYKGTSRAVDVQMVLRAQKRIEDKLSKLEGPRLEV